MHPDKEGKMRAPGKSLQAGGEFTQVHQTVKKNARRRYRLAMNTRDERAASHWK
jgi:hypothetical protein